MNQIEVRKEQSAFLAAYMRKPQHVTLSVAYTDQQSGICYLNILRGNKIVRIDNKHPVVDLTLFPFDDHFIGPRTEELLWQLKEEALKQWLARSEFLLRDIETGNLPNIRFGLRLESGKLPYGVDLRSFIETSAHEILKSSPEYEAYIAIGRPKSTRKISYFRTA